MTAKAVNKLIRKIMLTDITNLNDKKRDFSGKAFSGDAYNQACDIEHLIYLYFFVEKLNVFYDSLDNRSCDHCAHPSQSTL